MRDVIIPVLLAYANWVLHKAEEFNIERLYFVSRDAQIFYKIAERICRATGGPDCRYLYGSRQAWFLPSFEPAYPPESIWPIAPTSTTAQDILRRFDMSIGELPPDVRLPKYGDPNCVLTPKETDALLTSLFQSRETLASIRTNVWKSRTLMSRYLAQEGLYEPVNWALVDVGWFVRGQRALRKILREAQPNRELTGFYFGVGKNDPHPCAVEPGYFHSFFDSEAWKLPLQKYHLVIEHVFTPADHTTVIGYRDSDSQISPRLAPGPPHSQWAQYTKRLHATTLDAVDEAIQTNQIHSIDCAFVHRAQAQLTRLLRHPTSTEVKPLSFVPTTRVHSTTQGETRTTPLASPITFRTIVRLVTQDWGKARSKLVIPWLEGSTAISSLWARLLLPPLIAVLRRRQAR